MGVPQREEAARSHRRRPAQPSTDSAHLEPALTGSAHIYTEGHPQPVPRCSQGGKEQPAQRYAGCAHTEPISTDSAHFAHRGTLRSLSVIRAAQQWKSVVPILRIWNLLRQALRFSHAEGHSELVPRCD